MGKAIQYILLHRKQLSAYPEYGEAAMTNNICERAIRNFTIGRKNWLFSASPKGAEPVPRFTASSRPVRPMAWSHTLI
ncbi:IS66 family transposase [Acidaminococcus fermentans]